jgi:hypothetical protein
MSECGTHARCQFSRTTGSPEGRRLCNLSGACLRRRARQSSTMCARPDLCGDGTGNLAYSTCELSGLCQEHGQGLPIATNCDPPSESEQ